MNLLNNVGLTEKMEYYKTENEWKLFLNIYKNG